MATAALIIFMMMVLLAVNFRGMLMSGRKQLAWLYSVCFVICLAVLVLNSLGVRFHGPSRLVMDISRALALID